MATNEIINAPGGQTIFPQPMPVVTPQVTTAPTVAPAPTKESLTTSLNAAQVALNALKAKDTTSASNITSSDAPVIKQEKKAMDTVTGASKVVRDTKYLDDEIARIESNLQGQESSINPGFNSLKTSQGDQQNREVGQTSVGLATAGGYLGFSGSGTAVMLSLTKSHRAEMQALESKRQQAIADARNAASGKRFDVVKLKAQEIKDIEQETYNRTQEYQKEIKAQAAKDTETAKIKAKEEKILSTQNTISKAITEGSTTPQDIFTALKGTVPIEEITSFINNSTPKASSNSKMFSFTPTQTGLLLGAGINKDDIASLNETINTIGYTDEVRSHLPSNVRAVTDKIYYGKTNPIAASTSTDTIIEQSANVELFNLVNNKGSVYSQKHNQDIFNRYMAKGNIDAAEQLINSLAIQGLPASQRTDFGKMGTIIRVTRNLKDLESNFAKTNPGVYTTLINSTLPFVGASKDPNWLKFVAQTQSAVNDYRNSIFGASLTGNELKAANLSLPDFNKDTASDIFNKIDSLQMYAKTQRASFIQDSIGSTFDNPTSLSTMNPHQNNPIITTPLPGEDIFNSAVQPKSTPGYWSGLNSITNSIGNLLGF